MATRSTTSHVPGVLFALAILTTLPIFWIIVLPVLALRPEASHLTHLPMLLVHAVGGTAMLALGACALFIGWTRRFFRRHKWFGYSYLGLGSVGAIAALYLSVEAPHEPRSLYVATGTLAVVWLAFAAMAWRAARNRRFDAHRDWMIRSYVLSWTFVGCRIASFVPLFPSLGSEGVTANIWLFWIAPVLICEMALQWRAGARAAV